MNIENSMPIAAFENLKATRSRSRSQSLDFEVTNEFLHAKRRSRSGADRFVKSDLSRDVYRLDTRSPRLVNKVGFEGTIANDHIIASFDEKTVFASESKSGSQKFAELTNRGASYEEYISYFIYKIRKHKVQNISFTDTYTKSPLDYLKSILPKVIMKSLSYYVQRMQLNSIGWSSIVEDAAEDIDGRLGRAFLPTREIHLKGPITPDRITYKGMHDRRLDYLDLAIF